MGTEQVAQGLPRPRLQLGPVADKHAVLVVYRLRKSDGAEGPASRGGGGAMAGAVDVIVELRRARATRGGR